MSKILNGIIFTVAATTDFADFVPVRQLLLADDIKKKKAAEAAPTASPVQEDSGNVVRGRKAARRAAKSKTAPQNFTSPSSNAMVDKILDARNKQIADHNKKNLERLEENQGFDDGNREIGPVTLEPAPLLFVKSNEEKAPAILAITDFTPIVTEGVANEYTKSLIFKRAARQLSIDLQVGRDNEDVTNRFQMPPIRLATAFAGYINRRKDFLTSLRFNIPLAQDAFNIRFAGDPSNTQYICTLIRDYALSCATATPRLQGQPMREVRSGIGSQMPPAVLDTGSTNQTYVSLLTDLQAPFARRPLSLFHTDIPYENPALLVRYLGCLIGKETLASYNISQNTTLYGAPEADPPAGNFSPALRFFQAPISNPLSTIASQTSFGLQGTANLLSSMTVARQKVDPMLVFDALTGAETRLRFEPSTDAARYYNGSIFQRQQGGEATVSYPFMPVRIRSPQVRTAFSFLQDQLDEYRRFPANNFYADKSGGSHRSVYSAYVNLSRKSFGNMRKIFERSNDERLLLERPFTEALNIVARAAVQGDKDPVFTMQLQIFRDAVYGPSGVNGPLMKILLIYLAFYQEKRMSYDGRGAPPAGFSTLLRNSEYLQDHNIFRGTVRKGFISTTLNPRDISVNPSIGDTSSAVAPEVPTTISVESEGLIGDSGTLESIFGVTFRAVADQLALEAVNAFNEGSEVPAIINTTQVNAEVFQNNEEYGSFSLDSYKQVLNNISTTTRARKPIDEAIDFMRFLPGPEEAFTYFNMLGQTNFSGIKQELMFASFAYLLGGISGMVLPRLVFGVDVTTGFLELQSTVNTEVVMLKKDDYNATMHALSSYVNDPEASTEIFASSFPELETIRTYLRKEQEDILNIAAEFVKQAEATSDLYKGVQQELAVEVEPGRPLGSYLADGFIPSIDLVKYLSQYHINENGDALYYNDIKTTDRTLNDKTYNQMVRLMSDRSLGWTTAADTKIMAIGIPTGLMEELEQITPIEDALDGVAGSKKQLFTVVVEKVDETNPFVRYDPLEFPYSRELFCRGLNNSGKAEFVGVNERMETTLLDMDTIAAALAQAVRRGGVGLISKLASVVINHNIDYYLKIYLDLQNDLNFQESAFALESDDRSSLDTDIFIPTLEYVDTTQESFLSASNAIFSPVPMLLEDTSFYNKRTNKLSLPEKSASNPYDYASFDYANTYGTIFNSTNESERVSEGLTFERTICLAFRESDFQARIEVPEGLANAEQIATQLQRNIVDAPLEEFQVRTPSLSTYNVKIKLGNVQYTFLASGGPK